MVKLLVTAALLAASVPALAAPPRTPPRAAPAPAQSCAPVGARMRTGGGTGRHDLNELTAAQAAAVERELGSRRIRQSAPKVLRIPVYFHVLHSGAAGNVPAVRINRQIAVLNAAYGGRTGGYDTGVVFTLKAVTRSDNDGWYRDPEAYETTFKPRLHQGGATTLNLYSADMGDQLLGWSTFPWRYRSEPRLDGVVIHAGSMPGGTAPHFDRGYTATHEIGHWLGLFHTFQDGCESPGDRVSDTAPERDPTAGCPVDKDTCTAPGDDPVHNFMDYSYDACMTMFTKGQSARIRQVWSDYRA